MNLVGAVATIAAKDLRGSVRSGYFLVMGIVTPLVLAVVLNLAFGGISSGDLGVAVAVLDEDRSPASAELAGVLQALDGGLLDLHTLPEGTPAADALGDGLRAVVVIPSGFGASLDREPATTSSAEGGGDDGGTGASRSGDDGAPTVRVLADPDAQTSVGVVRAVVASFAQQLDRERVASAAAEALGLGAPPSGTPLELEVVDLGVASRLDPTARLAAGMSTMFLLLVALLGVTGLLYERDAGTLARLLAAPIPGPAAVVAKAAVSVILGVVSGSAIAAATTLVLGAEWGPALGVGALVVGFSLAATGVTLLVAGAARSTNAANTIQASAAVLLAVLGGGFVPVPDGGPIGLLSRLTPHRWFLEGLDAMAGASWSAALPAVVALVGFAVATGLPGVVLTRRRLTA